jgi:hypothetical protein
MEKDRDTKEDKEINKTPQVTLNSSGSFVYSDEQLTEIAELADTKDKLMTQYPTAYTRTVSIVQNNISNATPAIEVSYRGETKVLRLMFDGISGSKISSHYYNTLCSKNEFDTLAIGQSLSDVQMIDPEGEYFFLYTGRNDVPKVSTHYTTDGFVITITYDKNNVIEKMDIVPM